MRIAFVAHNFVYGNGQGRINLEIVCRALQASHEVTLFANRVAPELSSAGVRWERVRPLVERPHLISNYSAALTADRMLARTRGQFDIVVGAGFTLRTRHDFSLCQFVHGAWIKSPVHVSKLVGGLYGKYQKLYSAANVRWERQAYAAARRVVAPSEKIKSELISIGVPSASIDVVYNGVDLEEFCPAANADEKVAERAALGLPGDLPLGLFVGDIRTPRKNLDSVLKAMVEVPSMRLAVAGELSMSPYPAMARQLGLQDRVHFVGFTLEVKRYMRACDLFVFPSRYEAGTLVLMEAAASGLPIVTAKTAGGAEVFGEEAATVIDNPDDVPALTAAMARLTASQSDRESAGTAALSIARQHAWARMADEYLQLFDALHEFKSRSGLRPN